MIVMLYNPTISTIDLVIPDFPYINVFILILCIYESSPKDKKDTYFFWTDNIHFTSFFFTTYKFKFTSKE